MQEEDIELIRKGLLQLFTDGQEATTVEVPHEVGLLPEIAKRYGIKTSTLNVRDLAEFLASIDGAREREWLNVEDAIDIARITSRLGSVEVLANLEEVLQSLADLDRTAEVSWFDSENSVTGSLIRTLLDAEVSPETLRGELYLNGYDVLALSKSRDLPIWLCHWIHENGWLRETLERQYDNALEENFLERDAPRLADEYARKKPKD